MARWFNIAGACFPDEHYMVPPERRGAKVLAMAEQGRWFSFVSGWQTGKTTVLQWVVEVLGHRGRVVPLQIDLETAREKPDVHDTLRVVLSVLDETVARERPELQRPGPQAVQEMLAVPDRALVRYLRALAASAPSPLVLLFDEADGLVGAAMVSFLTQLRELYLARKRAPAPYTVVLVGRRDVRDYTLAAEDRRAVAWLGTSSPFNIAVETVGLVAFSAEEVAELVAQHTAETGQAFTAEAVSTIVELTQGHPWLVNALADQATRLDVTDRAVAITPEHIERARETIILERRTHIDSLIARLREDRVRRVLDPMLAGTYLPADVLDDDLMYVRGLGLVRIENGRCVIANPIYREVIPRALSWLQQIALNQQTAWYVRADGTLDVPKLMAGWQEFWRKDGHLAADGFSYKEAGPHLMLMAFLQRVVNGGGRIEREYALGKGALDLLIEWKAQRVAIEVKLRRDTETEDEALEQVLRYLDALGLPEGWLVLFELRSTAPWSERLFTRAREIEGRTVHVIGC